MTARFSRTFEFPDLGQIVVIAREDQEGLVSLIDQVGGREEAEAYLEEEYDLTPDSATFSELIFFMQPKGMGLCEMKLGFIELTDELTKALESLESLTEEQVRELTKRPFEMGELMATKLGEKANG